MNYFLLLINKYENSNARWREHWWNKVEEFYQRNQEIRKAYIIDTVSHSIEERKQKNLPKAKNNKEFLYVGHYYNKQGEYVLKIGTTNCLARRQNEHCRNYESNFVYDWTIPLSKYNTLRYEDKNREQWKIDCVGEFISKDRFLCYTKPKSVTVKIRKEYVIEL